MEQATREAILLSALEGNLRRLLTLASNELCCPLLLGDQSLTVLGWSGLQEMPAHATWEDFITAGFAPALNWSDELMLANSVGLSNGFSACRVPQEGGGSHWIIDIPVNAGRELHLILSSRGATESETPPDPDALGLVCLAIRGCVQEKVGDVSAQTLSAQKLLLHLMRNSSHSEPVIRNWARSVHLESEGYFSILLLNLRGYRPTLNSIATISSHLSALLDGFSVIDGEILLVFISHASDDPVQLQSAWSAAASFLAQAQLFGIYSPIFFNLGQFHYHYTQLLSALSLQFCLPPDQWLVSYEDLHIYSLIAMLHADGATSIPPHPAIQQLQRIDAARNTNYVETLWVYLLNAQKATPTCKALHIHRNTLDYRLQRIEEFTHLNWSDGTLMFRLYFSLCVLRYEHMVAARRSTAAHDAAALQLGKP